MKKFLKKFIVVLMALLMISSVVSESAETVYAHKRGHSITRVHKTRRKASGRSRRASHPRRKVVRRKVKKRKAPKRHKKSVRRKAPRKKKKATRRKAPKKHKKSARKKAPKKKTPWWKKAVNGAKKFVKKAVKKTKKFVKKHGKGIAVFAGDMIGVNDIYTLVTGKDIGTGKKASRWVAAAWVAASIIPVGKIAGKAGKALLKGGKYAKRVIKASKGAKRVSKIFKRFGKGAKKLGKVAKAAGRAITKGVKKIAKKVAPKLSKKAEQKAIKKRVTKNIEKSKNARTSRRVHQNINKSKNVRKVRNTAKSRNSLFDELEKGGTKYSKKDVLTIEKNSDGKIMWLEKGNDNAGLKHIIKGHGGDFERRGIKKENIPDAIKEMIKSKPKVKGTNQKGPYAIYSYKKNDYIVAYGTNGFIVSCYPK